MFSIKTCSQCKYTEGIQQVNSDKLFPEPTVFSQCILIQNRFSYPVRAIRTGSFQLFRAFGQALSGKFVILRRERMCSGVATISWLFYRALLQKRPVILRSLLIVATPSQ